MDRKMTETNDSVVKSQVDSHLGHLCFFFFLNLIWVNCKDGRLVCLVFCSFLGQFRDGHRTVTILKLNRWLMQLIAYGSGRFVCGL